MSEGLGLLALYAGWLKIDWRLSVDTILKNKNSMKKKIEEADR